MPKTIDSGGDRMRAAIANSNAIGRALKDGDPAKAARISRKGTAIAQKWLKTDYQTGRIPKPPYTY